MLTAAEAPASSGPVSGQRRASELSASRRPHRGAGVRFLWGVHHEPGSEVGFPGRLQAPAGPFAGLLFSGHPTYIGPAAASDRQPGLQGRPLQ